MSAMMLAGLLLLFPPTVVALVNLARGPRLHRLEPSPGGRLMSVLVPARNEAANLRRLLPALRKTGYRPIEIVVLDDDSRDETAAVVRGHAGSDSRVRLVEGLQPPAGWTGKNWACQQLSYHARGDLLLFCDADVRPGPDAVGRTAAALDHADAVTAFPRHDRGGVFEAALVPLISQLPIAALLPLPLVAATRAPSLAVGNGQWFAWRRAAYRAVGGHARVRSDVLEDVRLARIAKATGLRLAPFVASRDLAIRMYRNSADAWEGFAKNLYPLAGGRDALALPAGALLVAATAVPLALPFLPGIGRAAWAPLGLLLVVRGAAAALFRGSLLSIALHPLGAVAAAVLLLDSRRRHRRGAVRWKNRVLETQGVR